MSGGDTPPPSDIEGLGITRDFTGEIVWARDFPVGRPGEPNFDQPEQCLEPFPEGTFSADQIVLCDRGEIARIQKGRNVRAGGAGALILGNIPFGSATLVNDVHVLPAIHINQLDAGALRTWLSSGTGHQGTITDTGTPILVPEQADIMSSSSSTGPYEGFDYLVPAVGAPGTGIYAAGADLQFDHPGLDTPDPDDDPSVQTSFGIISGTSMASPHAAGSALLLKQLHPDWTAAEVLSALMTTGFTGLRKPNGVTPADPFNFGGGRIQVDRAANTGLVLHETDAGFDAADPSLNGDPGNLNLAALVREACRLTCSWERVVRAAKASTWAASSMSQNGMTLIVSPERFTLAEGETQALTVSADLSGASAAWNFGNVILIPENANPDSIETPPTVFSVAVQLSGDDLPEALNFVIDADAGSRRVEDLALNQETATLTFNAYGLARAEQFDLSLEPDSNRNSPYDNLADGVHVELFTVPAGAERFVAETFDSEAPDIDLYVGVDRNGDGRPSASEQRCASTSPEAVERCDLDLNGESPEQTWWVLVQNWGASATPPDAVTLAVGHVPSANSGNFDVSGPARVAAFEPFDIEVSWNEEMEIGDIFYGVITLAAPPERPFIGKFPVRLERGGE